MRSCFRGFCGQIPLLVLALSSPHLRAAEYFYEDFEGYASDDDLKLVGGWLPVDENTPVENATWTITNPGGRRPPPGEDGVPTEGIFVISDSDVAAGDDLTGTGMSHDLHSPSFSCVGATAVWLHMDCTAQMNNNGVCVFDVDVSTNGGGAWTNVYRTVAPSRGVDPVATASNADGFFGRLHINITSQAAGKADVQFRLRHFEPNDDWWIAVDNVVVDDMAVRTGSVALLFERFEVSIPDTWTARSVVNPPNAGTQTWSFEDPCKRSVSRFNNSNLPYSEGRGIHRLGTGFALMDSQCDPAANGEDEYLITPVLDCSKATAVFLQYKSETIVTGASVQEVLLSLDGGATFEAQPIFSYNVGGGFAGGEDPFFGDYTFAMGAAAGKSQVAFAFHYQGPATEEDFYWAVDDVKVTADGEGLAVRNCTNREFIVNPFDTATSSVTMTWRAIAGDQGFRVLGNSQQIGADLPASATSYTDSDPPAGGTVTYSLQSLQGAAVEFECTAAPISVVACPKDFSCCVNQATKAVTLNWRNGVNLAGTGYRILRNNVPRTTVPLTASTFTDTTLPGPGSYDYTLVLNGGDAAQCPALPLKCTAVVLGDELLLFDDFDCYVSDAALFGAGWQQHEEGQPTENAAWTTKDSGGRGNPPNPDGTASQGKFIISDSDAAGGDDGEGTGRSHDIWTPSFNCTGKTSVWLHASCSLMMNNNGVCVFDVDVSSDGGTTWDNAFRRVAPARGADPRPLADIPETLPEGPQAGNADGFFGTLNVDLTAFAAGEPNVKVRFRQFEPSDDWWMSIDNLLIDTKAPGRGSRTLLGPESFSDDIPGDWSVDSVDGIAFWRGTDPCLISLLNSNGGIFPDSLDGHGLHHFDQNFAIVSLDEGCTTPAGTETLSTPVLDCSGTTAVYLHVKSALNITDAVAEILLSTDSGVTFDAAPIFSYNNGGSLLRDPGNSETIYNEHDFVVPRAANQKKVVFAFRYTNLAARTSFWALDDIEVTADGGGVISPTFHRGDADDNGQLQLTDAVRILGFLFLGQAPPTCLDAADADDNGVLQLTDAVRILGFLFLGQAPPAPPGPPDQPCGTDVGAEDPDLGCASYTKC